MNSISQMRQRWRLSIRPWRANYWRGVLFILFVMVTLTWLIHLLDVPFHEDEAIYAAWSLRIVRGDPWLWVTPVDKPPLTFYPMAVSIALFGRHEWAARLPNLLWTGLLLVTLWRIAKHHQASGWLAVMLALFSPLLWAQAASAFTDAAMVALAFLAVERGMSGRATQAGVAFGLGFLAKPTALLLLPLVVTTLPSSGHALVVPRAPRTTEVVTTSGRFRDFLMACAAPLLLAWAWDASRAAPSWWALGAQAYGTLGKMEVGQIEAWIWMTCFSLGPLFLMGMMARSGSGSNDFSRFRHSERLKEEDGELPNKYARCQLGPKRGQFGPKRGQSGPKRGQSGPKRGQSGPKRGQRRRFFGKARVSCLFASFLLKSSLQLALFLWIPVHMVLGFQPWERYLLPLVPIMALFFCFKQAKRPRHASMTPKQGRYALNYYWCFILLVPFLIQPFQLEPHDGRWQGIAEMGSAIETLPGEAVVYYFDAGRPLAWYAANAQATLVWLELDREPLTFLPREDKPSYIVLRASDSWPARLANWYTVKQSGHFRLLKRIK